MNYQYFIEVVPTDIQAVSGFTRSTYQYSVKDQERPIDHDTGSHGSPGIYFKYDVSALKVVHLKTFIFENNEILKHIFKENEHW